MAFGDHPDSWASRASKRWWVTLKDWNWPPSLNSWSTLCQPSAPSARVWCQHQGAVHEEALLLVATNPYRDLMHQIG